jgi:hypothetical protein
MVDPKKDYEQLMRYLQEGAQKRKPVTAPEQTYTDAEWQLPASATVASPSPAVKRAAPKPFAVKRPFQFHWPKWKLVSIHKKTRIAIAAVASLILLVLLWKAYTFYQLSPDTIYNDVYVPFNAADAGANTPGKNSIAQYYTASNYVAATLQAKKQKQLSDGEKLLAGLSYLQREDFSSAIKWLEPLSNNFKSPYRQQAEFYVALTYLKNEDYDHCIEKMEHIAYAPTHVYHDRISKSLISDIKMLKWK